MELFWRYLPVGLTLFACLSFLLYYGILGGPVSFRRSDYAVVLSVPLPAGWRNTRLARWTSFPAGIAAACVAALFAEALAGWFLPHRLFLEVFAADKAVFYGVPVLVLAVGAAGKLRRGWTAERFFWFWRQDLWPGLLLVALAVLLACIRIIS